MVKYSLHIKEKNILSHENLNTFHYLDKWTILYNLILMKLDWSQKF